MTTRAELSIEGMSCGHCVAQVRKTLESLDGVQAEEVAIGSARVSFDPARTPLERIEAALYDEGYPATPRSGG